MQTRPSLSALRKHGCTFDVSRTNGDTRGFMQNESAYLKACMLRT